MSRALALLSLTIIVSACTGPPEPPAELEGLWSVGPAACAAGVGVRFEADAIRAVYDDETQTLFSRPRYELESQGESFRIRIIYELPRVTGGVRVTGARGRLVLARRPDGSVTPLTHSIIDARTGSARMRIADDPVVQALTLAPCGAHEDLRGRI